MQEYFHTWKLKINIKKCGTILFRPCISKISDGNSDVEINAKNFGIYDYKNSINFRIKLSSVIWAYIWTSN